MGGYEDVGTWRGEEKKRGEEDSGGNEGMVKERIGNEGWNGSKKQCWRMEGGGEEW